MYRKHKRKILAAFLVLLFLCSSVLFYSKQVNGLTNLGYTRVEAKNMVNLTNFISVVEDERKELDNLISEYREELIEIGYTNEAIDDLISEKDNLLSQKNTLLEEIDLKEKEIGLLLEKLEKQADELNIKYQFPESATSNFKKHLYLKEHLDKEYARLIAEYEKYLRDNGYTAAEIKHLKKGSNHTVVQNMRKEANATKKLIGENGGFQNQTLQAQAMRMFRETNKYRASLGLKPYKYNNAKQDCVFKEARAYARNKNPHNWLCDVANENASLASVNSDYVAIAMHFFKNDPPHEAVLSGNYNSVAIAFVESNGMVYMIMGVFY